MRGILPPANAPESRMSQPDAATLRRPVPARNWTTRVPWNDKAGRFSLLKTAALVLVCLPAAWLAFRWAVWGLGPRPLTETIHRLGDWTIYLLLITLAITPARRLFEWSKLIQVRRIVGVAALCYILAHFAFYIADSKFDLGFVSTEIVLRIYLTIGFAAILMLVALGVTSTDGWVRRMGAKAWNNLHTLIYPATALGIIHYYLQSKVDVTQPVLMTGFFVWLMGHRVMARWGFKDGLVPLLVLSVVSAALTMLAEASWYGLMTGIGFRRIFFTNFDFAVRIAPAWWVLAAGLAVTAVSEIRRLSGGARRGRKPAAA